jgi:predicted DCC family thiol-disulfide oxidoreductase YuxK
MKTAPLTLYYDGLCPLCSREMDHYRRHAGSAPVAFVDITEPGFDAAAHGLDPRRIHRVMHARQGDRLFTAVDAFIALWETLPGYTWLARLARVPALYELMKAGYHVFAFVRPWLPRRRRDCATGTCQV